MPGLRLSGPALPKHANLLHRLDAVRRAAAVLLPPLLPGAVHEGGDPDLPGMPLPDEKEPAVRTVTGSSPCRWLKPSPRSLKRLDGDPEHRADGPFIVKSGHLDGLPPRS